MEAASEEGLPQHRGRGGDDPSPPGRVVLHLSRACGARSDSDGRPCHLPRVRLGGIHAHGHGAYEPETTAIVRALLRPGQTFVDVGAHVGYFTLLGARAVGPTGQVYAFEPAPTNLAVLAKNVQVNGYDGRVTVVPKAVSNRSGTSRLFVADSDSMWHTILPHWGGSHIEVVATTLDEFLERAGWPPIHFVKIDVEGAEKEALEGMAGLSRRNPWLKLAVECAASNLPPGDDPEDVFRVLRDLGFVRLSIISRELIPVGSHREMLERAPASASWSNLLCEQ